MSEADAQQRQLAHEPLATFDRDARLGGRAGAGRDDHAVRLHLEQLVDRDLVVAKDLDVERAVDLAQPLDEVVGEGIEIVDERDHGRGCRSQDSGGWIV